MELKVINTKGKEVEKMKIKDDVFDVKANEKLLLQYLRVYMTNQRQGNASTKTRGDVKGSGKKPWQQKHTGRARVGSSRTPLWRHGGISHGPQAKSWLLCLPKKMKKQAMRQALSIKLYSQNSFVLDNLDFEKMKTAQVVEMLRDTKALGKSLFLYTGTNTNFMKSSANVKNVVARNIDSANAFDILTNKNMFITKDALTKLGEMLK